MTPTVMTLLHIGQVLVFACAIACLIFMGLYQALAPWWRSEAGRHVMAFMTVLFLALTLTAANSMGWLRDISLLALIIAEVTIFGLILAVICWRIVILLRAQFPRRR
mgnify:CR=1 FL=1